MARPSVSADELPYYRTHIREAIQEDGIICLECGAVRRFLGRHVGKHGLTIAEYRAQWGYNRQNPLIVPALREHKRRLALAQNLPALGPRDALARGRNIRRRLTVAQRLETRLARQEASRAQPAQRRTERKRVGDEALRSLLAAGLGVREIAVRTGLAPGTVRGRLRGLGVAVQGAASGLPRAPDHELLALCAAGLWPRDIADRLGMPVAAVRQRLHKLRRRGVAVATPAGPRPNPWRRVSDDALMALVRQGLPTREIAARVGIARRNAQARLRALRRRGLLAGPGSPAGRAA